MGCYLPAKLRVSAAILMKEFVLSPLAAASCGSAPEAARFKGGDVLVTGQISVVDAPCPDIRHFSVGPLQTSVGSEISLRASVSIDLDGGGNVSVRWSGTGGDVADPDLPTTTYTCKTAGEHQIMLTARLGNCERVETVKVKCVPAS